MPRERLTTRLISSEWDFVVITRFLNTIRVVLREKGSFRSFVKIFAAGKHGVPFRKYVVSPAQGSENDFLNWAKLAGPQIIELTVDFFTSYPHVSWPQRNYKRGGKTTSGNTDDACGFFQRLERLLDHTPNLVYLGIMEFESEKFVRKFLYTYLKIISKFLLKMFNSHIPAMLYVLETTHHKYFSCASSQLKIFCQRTIGKVILRLVCLFLTQFPHVAEITNHLTFFLKKRFSSWCEAFIRQAPLLQGAKLIKDDEFTLGEGQELAMREPLIIDGYPLKNKSCLLVDSIENLKAFEQNLDKETEYATLLTIYSRPITSVNNVNVDLALHPSSTITNLFYSEESYHNYGLVIQSAKFQVLRRVSLEICSFMERNDYPFQNCVLPTVQDLTLALHLQNYKSWNLGKIFPNVSKLCINFRSIMLKYQVRDLLHSFKGSQTLTALVLEDCSRTLGRTYTFISHWDEIFGSNKHPACSHQALSESYAEGQHRCENLDCKDESHGTFFPSMLQILS